MERGAELVEVRDTGASVRAVLAVRRRNGRGPLRFRGRLRRARQHGTAQAGIGWPEPLPRGDRARGRRTRPGRRHGSRGGRAARPALRLPARRAGQLAAARDPAGRPAVAVRAARSAVPASELQSSWTGRAWTHSSVTWRGPRGSGCSTRCRTVPPGAPVPGRDAAHAYSPATGQGMNAAIQDSANLGWSSPSPSAQPATAALLDSYEQERRPVARQFWPSRTWRSGVRRPRPPAVAAARRLAPLAAPPARADGRRHLITPYRAVAARRELPRQPAVGRHRPAARPTGSYMT